MQPRSIAATYTMGNMLQLILGATVPRRVDQNILRIQVSA